MLLQPHECYEERKVGRVGLKGGGFSGNKLFKCNCHEGKTYLNTEYISKLCPRLARQYSIP